MSLRHQTEDHGKVVARGSKQVARGRQGTQLRAGRTLGGLTLTDCVALCWKELTPPSYCLGRSFFSDCFHCQHDGFDLSLLAGKDSK